MEEVEETKQVDKKEEVEDEEEVVKIHRKVVHYC